MDKDKKIFEEPTVFCDECQHYWTDTCDGTREGVYKACTAFVATKRIDLPLQVKNLQKRLVHGHKAIIYLYILFIIHLLGDIFF